MLKPQANATRELVSLDGVWNFSLLPHPPSPEQWTAPLSNKLQIPVPASYNDILLDKAVHDHVDWVKYQRSVFVPRSWSASSLRYFIRCDAATHVGRVCVDETLVTEHVGGYTPFEADITSLVRPGAEFRLTIAVNNDLTNETIPPGSIEVLENGRRRQKYLHDFFNYAGLARSVWLVAVPARGVRDVTVLTGVLGVETADAVGIIDYHVETSGSDADETEVRVSVKDEDGNPVVHATGSTNKMRIANVRLWQPGSAYLYTLTVELIDRKTDILLDSYHLETGIRTVRVRNNQFLINGKPFYFTGFGKHEDTPVRGKGHDAAYMTHDFQLMDWMGANSFRTSHYPYAEEVMEFVNRHGIVVIDQTAAVGLNLGITSGLFGNKAPPTFSDDTINDKTREAHETAIRELIARDKNYACVVMWSIANEPGSAEDGAREYFEPLVSLTRDLDPTRPVCFTNFALAMAEEDRIADLFDVLCLNRYYGWYEHTGDLETADIALETNLRSWEAKYHKPIVMTEYGADAVSGLHTASEAPWSKEFQSQLIDLYHRVFDRVESVVGEHVWSFSDFQTSSHVFRVDGNKKGVFTRDRRPKMAVRALRQRWLGQWKRTPLHFKGRKI
ncbi:hypothetical protein P170DRAFT_363634 [Aspergillus steynii IBT 23096]|uniref:Beta-glucuronidase n=1 Tax=Aspergillus steynii IBT 23096 TaxID=1392250 RepID=A0A2I2G0U2_9EURO|nr:uncharacterized protein P170DRAFT_363634 [Aspergillus steynii IBT 23096]PLB46488.1 hypothetical protein P170DRAFT_363634 [Aspergillus steynii IBT 23096]